MSQKTDRLVKRLKHLSACYYDGTPLISDEEYDQLREELIQLEPDHPFLSQVGTPTGSLNKNWPTHKHTNLVGSLNKINDIPQDLPVWAQNKGTEFCLTDKYDGSTVVATYEKGVLQVLATRGDGVEGEDITPNASKIQGVPATLKVPFTGEVRGEAILFLPDFEAHFKPKGYKNARNAANGKVRDQNDKEGLQKFVNVIWFDINAPLDHELKTEDDKFETLKLLFPGKHVAPYQIATISEIQEEFQIAQKERGCLDFEIDGMVVKVNDLALQESLGVVSNRPKGAVALKFPPQSKITTLIGVEWQQGLTGRISPVAIMEPVDLGGVTIRRASLCNLDEIERLGLHIGDTVVVSRRNDVIPKVESVYGFGLNRQPIAVPDTWNGEPIERDGAYLITTNIESQGFLFGNLMTWIKVTKLKGFGPAVIRNLIDEGVSDIADFYEADLATFQKAAVNSEKMGQKLFDTRNSVTEFRLSMFLSGLNIPTLGDTNSTRLEKEFKTLDGVLKATVDQIQEIQGIKNNAQKIVQGLQSKKELIERVTKHITILSLATGGPLAGVSVCITGDLSIHRNDFHAWVKSLGGESKSSVSKNLSFLITNEPNSGTSKNQKADEYGVKKVTEEEFYTAVGVRP